MKSQNTQGLDFELIWATVVDVNDPEQLGRIKVRAPNDGTSGQVPDDALPWARTTIPATQPNAGGAGGTGGMGLQKGSTVVMFRDKNNFENQYIMGALHVNQTGKGGEHVGAAAGGRSTQAIGGLKDGLTAGKFEPASKMSKEVLSKAPAQFPQSKGKYPNTFINVTTSGFRSIMNDVAGETYKAEVHPTGTFTEMQADGSYVTYTTKNRKEAVDGTLTLGSEEDMVISTNGRLQIKAKGGILIETQGYMREYVAKAKTTDAGEDFLVSAAKQVSMIGGEASTYASKSTTYITAGEKVQLNDSGSKGQVASVSLLSKDEISKGVEDGKFLKRI
jgi:hypothetical protein